MPELARFIEDVSDRIAPLDRAAGQAWWDASTRVSEATEAAHVRTDLALREALGDPDLFRRVDGAMAPTGSPEARQLALLRDAMAPQQVDAALRSEIVRLEASIDASFNAFRGTLDGEPVDDNTIAEVLRTSDDAGRRRQAWEAAKEIGGEVSERVRRLAHLRNRAAAQLGYRDHFAMTLETSELDETELMATLDAVDLATRDAFARMEGRSRRPARAERFGIAVADLRPWHYDDPFFQAAPTDEGLDLDPWFRDLDQIAVTRAHLRGHRARHRPDRGAQRPRAPSRQEPTRVLHRHRSHRRRAGAVQQRARRVLDRDDAARVRACGLRRRGRRRRSHGSSARCTPSPPKASRCCSAG